MSKKLLFLISFVLVLTLAGSASAQDANHICFWSNQGDSNNWNDPNSWYTVDWDDVNDSWVKSAANSVPAADDVVCIGQGGDWFPYPNDLTALPPIGSCLIDSSVDAECYQLYIDANSLDPNQPSHLEMRGGTLTIEVSADDWVGLCIGWLDDGNGSMTVDGNSIVDIGPLGPSVEGGNLSIGGYGTGTGTLTMDGNCSVTCYHLDCTDSTTSEGYLNLYGGTLYTTADEDWTEFWMGVEGDSPNSTIDIENGKAILASHDDNELWWINLWIDEGKITAFGGTAPRAELYRDYTYPKTTLEAISTTLEQAWQPRPRPGAMIDVRPTLTWTQGDDANTYDPNTHVVYFSTDKAKVLDGSAPNTPKAFDANNYDPGILDWTTNYYWRIDEANDPCLWPGLPWSFKTDDHLAVDDMDLYADQTALEVAWTTAHLAKNGAELYLETDTARVSSGQSLMFVYRNTHTGGVGYVGSELEADATKLEIGTDWVSGDPCALVLYFSGDAANGKTGDFLMDPADYHITNDQMYVAVEDGDGNVGVVKYDQTYDYDMNDIRSSSWQEWNIDLKDPCFTDNAVDMDNVVKVYIGFGGFKTGQSSAGAGTKSGNFDSVWFDDIGLYPIRCVPKYGPATDVTFDCITNYQEVDILAGDWLDSGYDLNSLPPLTEPNRLARYMFDEGDGGCTGSVALNSGSVGTDANLTISGTGGGPGDNVCWIEPGAPHPNIVDSNYALEFGGNEKQIAVAVNDLNSIVTGGFTTNTITLTCWIKRDGDQLEWCGLVFSCSELPADDPDPHAGLSLGANDDWTAGGSAPAQNHLAYHWATVDDACDATPDGEWQIWWWRSGLLVPDNEWTFCAVAIEPEKATMYMMPAGGDMYKSVNIETHLPTTFEDPFNIGRDPRTLWGSRVLIGLIDDAQIFDYALSDSEVLYVAGVSSVHIGLVSLVDFDNSDDIDFKDYVFIANEWLVEKLWPVRPVP